MKHLFRTRFAMRALCAGMLFSAFQAPVHATTFNVSLNTPNWSGTSAILAFDLIDGGSPDNTLTIKNLDPATSLGGCSATGIVTFSSCPSGLFTLKDQGSFFNELLVNVVLGLPITFDFDFTSNAPDVSSSPDAFTFFVLDPSTFLPLIGTDDPTGAGAMFMLAADSSANGQLVIYNPVNDTSSIQVTLSNPVPEPGTLALILAGLLPAWRFTKRFEDITSRKNCHIHN